MRQKSCWSRRSLWLRIVVLGLALCGLRGNALAQEQERQRAFVYGINAALANSFIGSFAPPTVETIYLLADQTSILSPRMTQIYFWPITNEYKASWELLNEPVAGSLEISRNGQIIQSTEPTSYTINYTPRGTATDAQLFIGAEADAAHARFVAQQQVYAQAQGAYYKAQQDWMAAADDANRRIQAGEKVTLPAEPQPPEPLSVVSNGINQGIPIKLPAGSYQVQLRGRDGAIVPNSARTLVVFAARRSAVGYMVVPETRWTTPDQVTDVSDVIVGKSSSQLYLIPHTEQEYPARSYNLLQNPQQQVGETADWTWVMGEPITTGQLELLAAGQAAAQLTLTPYRVTQLPGATLGYEIKPFVPDPGRPNAAPDLVGYPIRIDQPGSGFEIRMRSPQGTVLPGSSRLVRTPTNTPLSVLALLALVPLLVGVVVIVQRRRKMRLPRNVAG